MTDYEDLGHTSCPGDPAHRDALTVPATPRGRAFLAEQEAERRAYLRGLEDALEAVRPLIGKTVCAREAADTGEAYDLAIFDACNKLRALAKEKPHAD